jgi:uncharacterized protein YecT (DUF1311 family)
MYFLSFGALGVSGESFQVNLRRTEMFASVATAALATQLVLVAGDKVPSFDLRPSCHAAASIDPTLKATFQSCMDDEQGARRELEGQWLSFRAGDRRSCSAETQAGGPPSYVELLVCLQDAKTARGLESSANP